ncbi:MAG TPA: HepT-like ribonuclease domain-containing protein [Ramlibacter sp.]|uniref:HepT-like ribonuclease domain-containing protein n=1 Tax=Ramlibacter sp. TaxID=1917967 RepID=UPI002D808CCD|nr:HepT-like ribonuclease domain-containing protein [Ramlibacter sp.]HET8748579.1 HepT-like ribonuclease domain-containing protein [Ramlibacter sp.]
MERDARAFLWDVLEAAQAIESFVQGLDATSYAAQPLVHSAVERKFLVIGEALNQLSKADPTTAARIPDLRAVIGFRNLLVHGYAEVDHDIVWYAIHKSLPQLREVAAGILKDFAGRDG